MSFDITAAPGIKVPPGYHQHFKSFDGAARQLVVEGAGGPSWFTEYNVLTGLSARSYGRFATSVTRIAGGRVTRGLPHALSRCGYKTFSLYPFYGAFLGSRNFQTTAGIQRYMDMTELGTRNFEPDSFYFDQATKIIARERGDGPLFLFVYTVANHFPWDTRLRPELTPNWRDLGNAPNIDEYIRRQGMTAHDYAELLDRLKRDFPTELFLIVRFGDHQPEFGYRIIDPTLTEAEIARHLQAFDPRYFTSYYAIDTVNFSAVNLSSALNTLDAPYLPLVVQEAAGVPLDPSFAEQKKILQRCHGLFYRCAGGAEVRRFNRLLDRCRPDQGAVRRRALQVGDGPDSLPRFDGSCRGHAWRTARQRPRSRCAGSAVALSDVSIAFRLAGGGRYTAVERATLNVADGEFVAIVGPTGCGKSTLLNIAAGLLAPSAGRVDIFGSPLAALNRQAGYLFQADALFPWKTALENVAIGLETAGTPTAEARARAQSWLTRVGLGSFGDRYPHMLSGGQRKRVGPGAGADPRSENPADGRAVRPARCADPPDHGQPAARSVERRPQGGAVRHPRSGRGDRACPTASSSCRRDRRRASSATGAVRCRGRATFPK